MKTRALLSALLLWVSIVCYPQAGKLFTADSELSNSLINQVYQDRNGIVWVATEDGLNRYDGAKFTTYKHDEENPNSLLHNYVRMIYEDKQGRFFLGFLNGLQIYDDATDTFQEIPMHLVNDSLFNPHVITMQERYNGEILIGTGGLGVYKLIDEQGKLRAKQIHDFIPTNLVNRFFEDREHNLWLATDTKGIYCMTPAGQTRNYPSANGRTLNLTSDFCQDTQGNLYAGNISTGLYVFNSKTDSFVPITFPGNPNLPIKSLLLNKKNELLIGTDGNGLKTYIPGTPHIVESNTHVTIFDFTKAKVHSIMEDNSGNIWLGLFQRGVMMLPVRSSKFNYIGYKSVTHNTIGSNCIMSLFQDNEGILWVGTDCDGIYGITPEGKQLLHYPHTQAGSSVPSTIMTLFEDSNHDFWVGSYLSGLAKMNRKTGQCEYIRDILDENGHPGQHIYSLVEDSDKNLWIGTMGAGLFCMDLRTRKVTQYAYPNGQNEDKYVHNWWINSMLISRDNKLYIATYDGMACMDLATRSFRSTFGSEKLFPFLSIYTLFEDKSGDIWAGSSTGLFHLERSTQKIAKYTMKDGLPNNVICAIKGDPSGNLWITTNYGLSQMNPKDRTFINYYANDGLQGNEFSKNTAWVSPTGQFIFGGLNGITCFYPQDITYQQKKLQVRITGFYIHDLPVRKGMKSGSYDIIDSSVLDARNFHLSHKDNSFSIEFATTEFSSPEQITYIYSMNDDNWISLRPGINRVTFSNLAPGEYRFKVKAKDYGIHSEVKEIIVLISPAWYASGWAKLVYFLLAVGVILLILQQARQRYRVRQRLQEHIHAKEINEAKLQFFINISHEIRTPLSLIISPLKKLMVTDKDNERQKSYYNIHRNTERILRLINQLLDIRKIDKGQMLLRFQEVEMVELIEDISSIFDDQINARQIEFRFHHSMEQLMAWVDPKNFDKILLNVLSNAIKFTPKGGAIDLWLNTCEEETRPYFEIIVSDNGTGINEPEIERIFERFYQTRNKPAHTEGTGVGLHLTRSLVELHRGTIQAENNKEGQGCRFIIRLPLGNSHLKPEEMDENPVPVTRTEPLQTIPVDEPTEDEVKIRSKSKRHVIVVDDDKEIRKYICQELAAEYHTVECANGKEALSRILEKTPDLVISDVMMPEMDGITLCRKIRQNVNINHVPVILLTAKTKEEDNLEGLETGADAYLLKPFSIEVLRKTAQTIIRNREMLRNTFSGSQLQKDKIKTITIKSTDDKLLEKVMKLINENIGNPELSVEMLATRIGISRVHLHRKLKELTNQSTRDLIRNIRLQQAASLLSSKSLNVTEVATATGFTNLTYFSSAFKEMYGMAPMAYMEAHLKKRGDS